MVVRRIIKIFLIWDLNFENKERFDISENYVEGEEKGFCEENPN